MKSKSWPVILAWLALAIQGCTERVRVPPRIDLKQHEVVGVLDFECSGHDQLGPFLTRRFVDAVRRDQGLVRIAMLGTHADVLADIEHARLDQDAFKEIGRKHQVTTVFTGNVDCKTNSAPFLPRYVSQADQPTPNEGELLIWIDTDDNSVHLVFNDPTSGVVETTLS